MEEIKSELTPEEERQKNLELLEKYRPIDDDFMRELFRNNLELAQFVLRIIMDRPDLTLIKEETQYDLQHLFGERSICLDVFSADSEYQLYDLEPQRDNRGAEPHRARYHSSAMDVDNLKSGEKFNELPNTYVIFFTENDVFGYGKAIYPIERVNMATGELFNDGEHIIYVNGAYINNEDNSDLAKLIHDFRCSKADEMLLKPLADRTRFFKETLEGVERMCKAMEERVNNAKYQKSISFAIKLLKRGKETLEEIAEDSELPIEKVKELSEQLKKETA